MQVEIKKLKKVIDGKVILDDVNLIVKKGQVISLIGPSGSGKTTLLRTMAGLEEKSSGTIDFLSKKAVKGMIFQNFNLFPHKTVLENVTEALIVVEKMDKKEAQEIGKKLLANVGLQGKEEQMPKTISGGEKQRVAIARALARKPDILFLDEPTSALDPEMVGEVLKVIKKLRNSGMTLVLASHEMDFVKEISDKVVFMEKGKIVLKGTSEEIFSQRKGERVGEFLNRM